MIANFLRKNAFFFFQFIAIKSTKLNKTSRGTVANEEKLKRTKSLKVLRCLFHSFVGRNVLGCSNSYYVVWNVPRPTGGQGLHLHTPHTASKRIPHPHKAHINTRCTAVQQGAHRDNARGTARRPESAGEGINTIRYPRRAM